MEGSLLPFVLMILIASGALYYAAKIMSIELKFSQAVIVSVVSTAANAISGGLGVILSLLAYFGLLKVFTDSSILKLIVLSVISLLITFVAFKLLIAPMILSSLNISIN